MLYRFIIALLLILPIKYGVANEERIARVEQQLSEFDEKSVATLPLLIELASTYLYKDPALAERYALQALPISVESEDDISRAEVSRLLGMATMYQGKNEEAFTYLTRAITAARNTNNPHLLSVCNRSLGVFLRVNGGLRQCHEVLYRRSKICKA